MPGCKVVIIAWLVAVSLVLGGIAAFKVRNFWTGVERAEAAAARRAGRACRAASTRFLDVETAPAPTAVFAEPAPGDRGAAYLAEPEPRKAAPSEDPPPATPVAAAAAFAPIDPRSSHIQKAAREAAVVAARAPRDPGQDKRAKFPTSKAPISAVFHSFRLIFGRAIISWNGLEAWMCFP